MDHRIEAALHRFRRARFAGGQIIDDALDIRAIGLLAHAEVEVQQVAALQDDVRWPGVADLRVRPGVDRRAVVKFPGRANTVQLPSVRA